MNQHPSTLPAALSYDKDTLADDVRALVAATSHMAEEAIGETRKRLADALESGGKLVVRLEGKAVEGAKSTDKVLHEHPYEAVVIALGVGALIGFLAAHR